jgi:hypothetical protein
MQRATTFENSQDKQIESSLGRIWFGQAGIYSVR